MSFTTIDAVAAHYPGFQRGVADQNPTDTQIQAWIEGSSASMRSRQARTRSCMVRQA